MIAEFRYCPTQAKAMAELDAVMKLETATGAARHKMLPSARLAGTASFPSFHLMSSIIKGIS